MNTENEIPRLLWACRRGMLELDLLLRPFVEDAYSELDETQKLHFKRLLNCDDPDLFAWFMGHQACQDPDLAKIVSVIIKRVKV